MNLDEPDAPLGPHLLRTEPDATRVRLRYVSPHGQSSCRPDPQRILDRGIPLNLLLTTIGTNHGKSRDCRSSCENIHDQQRIRYLHNPRPWRYGSSLDVFGIENIEAFIFHCPHIEIASRHDHKAIEIEFQTKALFIPTDTIFQRIHGVLGFIQIAVFYPDLQQYGTARFKRVVFFLAYQLTGD